MSRYAENTTVDVGRSRAEIERVLMRYGADQFVYGWETERARLGFRLRNRQIMFELTMPDRQSPEFTRTPTRRQMRSQDQAIAAWEQAVRQRWRALLLVIKAKLEAVEAGITSFESEFLANTMLPDGRTVGQWIEPQLQVTYDRGQMPRLLPGPTED